MHNLRSWLFGSALLHVKGYEKAIKHMADVYVIDLEDSVPPDKKQLARNNLIEMISINSLDQEYPIKAVRINNIRSLDGILDIATLTRCSKLPRIIFLSKVRSSTEITILRDILSEQSREKFHIFSIIETADAVISLYDIARVSDGLIFGAADYSAELGNEMSFENTIYVKQKIILAAAQAKIPPIDTNSFEFEDQILLEKECNLAKKIGFTGKAAIHPKQIATINNSFGYSSQDIKHAEDVIRSFYKNGQGFSIENNEIIAPPFVRKAEELLKRAKLLS